MYALVSTLSLGTRYPVPGSNYESGDAEALAEATAVSEGRVVAVDSDEKIHSRVGAKVKVSCRGSATASPQSSVSGSAST